MTNNNTEEIKAKIAGKITLATSQMLNSPEQSKGTIEFLEAIIKLLESVNDEKIDINKATKQIATLASIQEDTKKESKSETSNSDLFKPEGLQPQIIENVNSKKNSQSKNNDIEWESVDFVSYVYGNAGGSSYFTSTPMLNLRNEPKAFNNGSYFWMKSKALSICGHYSNKTLKLQYVPQNEFGPSEKYGYHPKANRSSDPPVNNLFFKIPINKLNQLALTEKTKICLENGENLRDAIENIIFEKKYKYSESLPKVKIPFYKEKKLLNSFDIEFANILYDFLYKGAELKYIVSKTSAADNYYDRLNIPVPSFYFNLNNSNNDSKSLSLTDAINLTSIFSTVGNGDVELDLYIDQKKANATSSLSNCREITITSNAGIPEELKRGDYLSLDINDGLSSKKNIKILWSYLAYDNCVVKTFERWNRWYSPQELKEKEGENVINLFSEIQTELLNRLSELYKRKFNEEMSEVREEANQISGIGRKKL